MKTATAIDIFLQILLLILTLNQLFLKLKFRYLLLPLPSIGKSENETTFIYKRTFSSDSIEMFIQKLYEINWEEVETNQNPNETYKIFPEKIRSLYNHFFPEKKIVISKKDLKSPWITNGIKKSSKRKQCL